MRGLHLDKLKPGCEAVSVRNTPFGLKIGAPVVVIEYCKKINRWRYARASSPTKTIGAFGKDGGSFDFMSKSESPDYYFSANPKHVEQSKLKIAKAKLARESKDAQDRADLTEFKDKLDKLLSKYGVGLSAEQTEGDIHGVSVCVEISKGNQITEIYND